MFFEKNKLESQVGMDRIINAWDIACKMAADHGMKVSSSSSQALSQ